MFIFSCLFHSIMARILIGGPEGEHKEIHDKLAAALEQEHSVTYIKNDSQSVFWELVKTPMIPIERRYNLVLYDSGLLYPENNTEQRIEYFETIAAKYLAITQAQIIILAEFGLAAKLQPLAGKKGFMQIDEPYNLDRIVRDIKDILETKTPVWT